jgi:hypothetical protein
MTKSTLAACSALLLAGCAASSPSNPLPAEPSGCPIVGSTDWAAWVNAMPGPGASPTLIATGKVTTPTGGYRVTFDPQLIVRESYPVQIVATLRVAPPPGGATQAIVTHEVRGQWGARETIGAVDIVCGRKVLARISPVQSAV